jgi:transcriptional regulator with XRE-family HTH domain
MKNKIGSALKIARTQRAHLSTEYMAKLLGISQDELMQIESGKSEISDRMLVNIFHAAILHLVVLEKFAFKDNI